MNSKKSKYIENENGHLERKGLFAWFYNFFYYYKSYVIVAALVVAFVAALLFSMSKTRADLNVIIVTGTDVTNEQMEPLYAGLDEFMKDIDKDGVKYMHTEIIKLVPDPKSQNERDQYKLLEDQIRDKEVAGFFVDEYAYEYLKENNALRDLAFFGIPSDEEYRLRLNDMNIFENIDFEGNMYLTMKYMPDAEYEDYYISLMTSHLVDIMNEMIKANE